MAILRAQAVFAPVSALPKDQVVNSFHFDVTDPDAADAEAVAEWVRDFYVATPAGGAGNLSTFIASSIADTGHQVRVYEYDEATGERLTYEGAPPMHVEAFDLLGRGSESVGLPNEVAVCMTMRNTTEVAVPAARRRGRIFFGPVEGTGLVAGASNFAVATNGLVVQLGSAGEALMDTAVLGGRPLVVWSRPYAGREQINRPNRPPLPALPARVGTAYPVQRIEVDDEFDIIRGRGRRAGARTVWT